MSKSLFLNHTTLFLRAIVVVALFFATKNVNALVAPQGSTPPNIHAGQPYLKEAITEALQFGPGIWVSPGMNNLTNKVLPAATVIGFDPPYEFGAGMTPAEKTDMFLSLLQSASPLLPAYLDLGVAPAILPMKLVYTPIGMNLGSPIVAPSRSLQDTIYLGFFNNGVFDPGPNAALNRTLQWAQNYYAGLKTVQLQAGKISGQSRGSFFAKQVTEILENPALSIETKAALLRQVYWRHNQTFATYRAMGLNPMWLGGVYDKAAGPIYYSPTLNSDYLVNSFSRFLYREGQKHLDNATLSTNELGLLDKVFAATLSFESGLINSRYAPIDPSCRYPAGDGTCLLLPENILDGIYPEWATLQKGENNHQINFGTASEYVIVFDVLKYLFPKPGLAEAEVRKIATSGDITNLKAQVAAKTGRPYPTNSAEVFGIAMVLFEKAFNNWNGLAPVDGGSILLVPRPSAAMVAAAAMACKRLDPAFWGALAEAEQALFKNRQLMGAYKVWASSLFNAGLVATDFQLALSDLASFRNAASFPGAYDGSSLSRFLKSALIPTADGLNFALVRGPDGLVSLDDHGFTVGINYLSKKSDKVGSTQYPNSLIESAAANRAIIDGRLLFTPNGGVRAFDTDNQLLPPENQYFTSFEKAVIASYQRLAVDHNFDALAPTAESYRLTTGSYKPLNPNSLDSRFFQPALQFWLVTSEKLNATGLVTKEGYNPPQLGSVVYEFRPRKNYQIASVKSVTLTDSSKPGNPWPLDAADPEPLGNMLPLDGFKPIFASNDWPNQTVLLYNTTVERPFLYGTNAYLRSATTIGHKLDGFFIVADPAGADGNTTGPGSLICQLLKDFEGNPLAPGYPGYPMRDMTVKCP